MCVVNLLQLFYSKQMALNKFTRGRQSPEGYPCSSRPSDATNHLSAAATESCFWKTEEQWRQQLQKSYTFLLLERNK